MYVNKPHLNKLHTIQLVFSFNINFSSVGVFRETNLSICMSTTYQHYADETTILNPGTWRLEHDAFSPSVKKNSIWLLRDFQKRVCHLPHYQSWLYKERKAVINHDLVWIIGGRQFLSCRHAYPPTNYVKKQTG